jgi:predicted TIM-barrel fold metal-dependent hydrolase
MAAMGALIGGGIFDLFPRIRAAIIETAGGWLPAALDRFDTHYLMSPGHVPNLKRMPREVIAEGRYFHGIDSWERSLEFCVEELGEDMWLFASDWPHGDTGWPEAVQQTVERPRLSQSARRKILGENALRLCPRING